MAISFVSSSLVAETGSNSSSTKSFSISAGSDRVVVGWALGERAAFASEPQFTATYNGNSGTLVGEAWAQEGTNAVKAFAWIWLETDLQASGAANMVLSSTVAYNPGSGTGFGVGFHEYSGVNQATPTNVLEVAELTDGTVVSGTLTTAEDASHILAAALHNITAAWNAHSGDAFTELSQASSRSVIGREAVATASLQTVDFTAASSWGRAAMVAFELEEAVALGGANLTHQLPLVGVG